MNNAAGIAFDILGTSGYASAVSAYEAEVPLADLTATTVKLPLFVIPKGATIIAAKATVLEAPDASASGLTLDVGTYKIAEDGSLGAAIDADALFAAAALTGVEAGDVVAPAATAHGALTTEDSAIVAVPKAVTTAAKEGKALIQVWTMP